MNLLEGLQGWGAALRGKTSQAGEIQAWVGEVVVAPPLAGISAMCSTRLMVGGCVGRTSHEDSHRLATNPGYAQTPIAGPFSPRN